MKGARGSIDSGVSDLASNPKHLSDFGRAVRPVWLLLIFSGRARACSPRRGEAKRTSDQCFMLASPRGSRSERCDAWPDIRSRWSAAPIALYTRDDWRTQVEAEKGYGAWAVRGGDRHRRHDGAPARGLHLPQSGNRRVARPQLRSHDRDLSLRAAVTPRGAIARATTRRGSAARSARSR
jgi:hypothetical protein